MRNQAFGAIVDCFTLCCVAIDDASLERVEDGHGKARLECRAGGVVPFEEKVQRLCVYVNVLLTTVDTNLVRALGLAMPRSINC